MTLRDYYKERPPWAHLGAGFYEEGSEGWDIARRVEEIRVKSDLEDTVWAVYRLKLVVDDPPPRTLYYGQAVRRAAGYPTWDGCCFHPGPYHTPFHAAHARIYKDQKSHLGGHFQGRQARAGLGSSIPTLLQQAVWTYGPSAFQVDVLSGGSGPRWLCKRAADEMEKAVIDSAGGVQGGQVFNMKAGGQGGWFKSVEFALQQAKADIARERSERERAERAARAARAKRRGVNFHKPSGRWEAYVYTKGKRHSLGYYKEEEMAAKAFDKAVIKIRGKHAVTNYPPEEYNEEMRSRGASEISVEMFILQLRSEAKRQNKLKAKEDKPKRAKTGYLLFMDHVLDQVKEDLTADLAEGEKLTARGAIVSAIAALWREQDKETKEEWQARAKGLRATVDQRPERAAVEVGPSTSRGGKAVEVDRPGPSKRPMHEGEGEAAKGIAAVAPVRREPLPQKRGPMGPKNPSSIYRGVTFHKVRGKWVANVYIKGKLHELGGYKEEEMAAKAYDKAVIKFRGKDAYTNFPAEEYAEEMRSRGASKISEEEFILQLRSEAKSKGAKTGYQLFWDHVRDGVKEDLTAELAEGEKLDGKVVLCAINALWREQDKETKEEWQVRAKERRDAVDQRPERAAVEGQGGGGGTSQRRGVARREAGRGWRGGGRGTPKGSEAAREALAASHGFGLSSVRFNCGTQDIHLELEVKNSKFHGTHDTILHPSCFDANAGLFEVLLTNEDAVLSDELNHASIIDGIRLCKAERHRYKHLDMRDLEDKLIATQTKRQRLIATDGVFSMDGHVAPLKDIVALANKYNALVFMDECHATGFLGKTGRGTEEYCGLEPGTVDIVNSTLGKAPGGGTGGYTTGRQEIVDLLRQKARPYLFSNTLAPAMVGACSEVSGIGLGRGGQ